MKVHFVVEIEGVDPQSDAAIGAVDRLERMLCAELDYSGHQWWIDVEGGETRYMPEGNQ